MTTADGCAALSRRLCRLHRQPRARARHRPACRLARRATERCTAAARPIPKQLERYIENGCYWYHELPDHVSYYRHANRDYLDWASQFGFIGTAGSDRLAALLRAAAEIPPGRRRATARSSRRRSTARASSAISIRCRSGIRPSRRRRSMTADFRCMRSPSGRWRCIIPGDRRMPGCGRSSAATGSI